MMLVAMDSFRWRATSLNVSSSAKSIVGLFSTAGCVNFLSTVRGTVLNTPGKLR